MIPSVDEDFIDDELDFDEIEPSKTYKMNIDNSTISGYADDIESVKQMVYKILNTERYEYIAYSWDFGIELIDLYGKRYDYVVAELERRIEEALLMDDRIESVDSFEFNKDVKKVICTFTVHTIFGDFNTERVVEI